MTEDITWLLPTDTNLGTIDKELHVYAIICDRDMCPLIGYVASIGVDGGHFVGTISFKREEEARVTIPVFANWLDAKQPASITGGVETLVVKAWKKEKIGQ